MINHEHSQTSRPPSRRARALVALLLLLGFYVFTILVALVLFGFPVAHAYTATRFSLGTIVLFAIGWIPGFLLLQGAFSARPPRFTEPDGRLERKDAPALFSTLNDLAQRAGTQPPEIVYLSAVPDLAVTEVRGQRMLVIGAPLLDLLTVEELRAGLAHELGHFIGGDTKLAGILAFTEATFQAVLESGRRSPFASSTSWVLDVGFTAASVISNLLVQTYARLYFGITRATSRRQELAADALAVSIEGRAVTRRTLEKVSTVSPLYEIYVGVEVAHALKAGAMPTDLEEGFREFSERFVATDAGHALIGSARTQTTRKYDSHPALVERFAAIDALPDSASSGDTRNARELLAMEDTELRSWLVDATQKLFPTTPGYFPSRRMSWAEIWSEVFTSRAKDAARKMAEKTHPLFPDENSLAAMFAAVVRAFDGGHSWDVVARLEPNVVNLVPYDRQRMHDAIGATVLNVLFQGALLERGGVIESSLGAPCTLIRIENEVVAAELIARHAMTDAHARAQLTAWAYWLTRDRESSIAVT